MTDVCTRFQVGLRTLLAQLGKDHPHRADARIYQQRLMENIVAARRYGDTATRRAERAEIVDRLNTLTQEALGISFSDLCSDDWKATSPAVPITYINTGGGAYIGGPVTVQDGDFIGRDQNFESAAALQQSMEPFASAWETESFEPETVLVLSGTFLMGDDDVTHATPQHEVDLPVYRIGRFPVTNAQFAEFIWKTGRVAPKELLWDGNEPPEDARDHPVTGVTWYDAMDYCAWLSEATGRAYTLPSEAQWEKAARGTDGRRYPWGETWDPACCHTDLEGFAAVDAYPAQSPYGCYDMVGNAREWTTTLWGTSSRAPDDRYAYPWADDSRNDVDAPRTTRRVVRGGRGSDPAAYKCAARRSYFPDRPGPRRNRHGFRVVVDISQGGTS